MMEELVRDVERLIRMLVDEPSAVSVETVLQADGKASLRVNIAAHDIGKLIGHSGRTARAIRVLVAAIGAKMGIRGISLDIPSTSRRISL